MINIPPVDTANSRINTVKKPINRRVKAATAAVSRDSQPINDRRRMGDRRRSGKKQLIDRRLVRDRRRSIDLTV